ncbi:MAG: thioredoxin domain-containing protein [Gemmobacter sp.]
MKRRDFLAMTAAVTLAVPLRARAVGAPYSPEMLEAAMAANETILLDFTASWCSTCAAQGRVLAALKAENPDYAARIRFIDVDWDQWKSSALVAERNIPRRSTLVVLKGEREIARVVAQTGRAEIKALLDAALAAS